MFRLLMSLLLMLPTSPFGRAEAQPQAACAGVSCAYIPVVVYSSPVGLREIVDKGNTSLMLNARGEVYNMTQSPVYDVTIEVRAYDDADQLIGTKTGKTAFFATLPGLLNPFQISTAFSSYHRFEAVITGWLTTSVQTYQPATITIDDIDYHNATAWITGTVRNDLATPLYDVHYMAWSLWQYYSFDPIHLADTLLPGETITYTTHVFLDSNRELPISVTAQGVVSPTLTTNQPAP